MRVTLSLGGLRLFNLASAHKKITDMWTVIYLTFSHKRFLAGADWPERKHEYAHPLLQETGTLLNVLDPRIENPPGSIRETHKFELEIGYGGDAFHPTKRGRRQIAKIASYHQTGTANMDQRELVVLPDEETHKKMVSAAQFIFQRELSKKMK